MSTCVLIRYLTKFHIIHYLTKCHKCIPFKEIRTQRLGVRTGAPHAHVVLSLWDKVVGAVEPYCLIKATLLTKQLSLSQFLRPVGVGKVPLPSYLWSQSGLLILKKCQVFR